MKIVFIIYQFRIYTLQDAHIAVSVNIIFAKHFSRELI